MTERQYSLPMAWSMVGSGALSCIVRHAITVCRMRVLSGHK